MSLFYAIPDLNKTDKRNALSNVLKQSKIVCVHHNKTYQGAKKNDAINMINDLHNTNIKMQTIN